MTRWTEYGHVSVVAQDDPGCYVVMFTALDDEKFTLEGEYDTHGEAIDGAIRWAAQRNLTLSWAKAQVRRAVSA